MHKRLAASIIGTFLVRGRNPSPGGAELSGRLGFGGGSKPSIGEAERRGKREFGGTAALPIWIDFMANALPPEQPPAPMPSGLVRLRIDRETGRRVSGSPEGSMLEYFLEEFLPEEVSGAERPVGTDELDDLF